MHKQTINSIVFDRQNTWQNKSFLTFDLDWAHDDIIWDTIEIVEKYNQYATWFVTHDTPLIKHLSANPKFEIGIHPNFNAVLNGLDTENHAERIIEKLKLIAPKATSVRSHSIVCGSSLSNLFAEHGLTHDCNYFIPDYSQIELKPWLNSQGMTMVPYFWEDDVAFLNDKVCPIVSLNSRPGVRVFDFHPIHVFLNTEQPHRYASTRPIHGNPKELISYRYDGYGARNQLFDILEAMASS